MIAVLVIMSAISGFLIYSSVEGTESKLKLKTSQQLREQTIRDLDTASRSFENEYEGVAKSLESTSTGLLNLNEDYEQRVLVDLEYASIAKDVDSVLLLDRNGNVLYNIPKVSQDGEGTNLSDREFFKAVVSRGQPYVSSTGNSPDGMTDIAIAVPVYLTGTTETTPAVLAAQITLDKLNERLSEFFSDRDSNRYYLIDSSGIILGAANKGSIGSIITNVALTTDPKEEVIRNNNINLMLQGRSGSFEILSNTGEQLFVTYEPISLFGEYRWTMLFIASLSQSDSLDAVVDDQRFYTLIAIVLIGAAALVFILFVLLINKMLHRTVRVQDVQIKDQLLHLQTAYEKLKEQDIIKDEFINIAAHELRTPVLPIILSAEGLADEIGGEANPKIEAILRNAKRINKLTNDILDVSRVESNTFKLQLESVEVRKLIQEAIQDANFKLMENKNAKTEILFETRLPDDKSIVRLDKGRVLQVMYNLLDNAINFTDQGSIVVSLSLKNERLKQMVEVRVSDSGRGIDSSIMNRLFEKFVTKSHKAKGTGLGLYLCKAIVEAHGGTIRAENNSNGMGATFSFTLPLY